MNTLTKGFAKRVISMLLVTIMVFSLGIVGLTSVSAANVDLAETGLSIDDNATLYCFNSYTNGGTWEDDAWDLVKMNDAGTRSWELVLNDYAVSNGDINFRFGGYLNYRNYYFFPGTDNDKIAAKKDTYVSPSSGVNSWEGSDSGNKSWLLSLENLQSYSTVDIYIKVDNSNNSDGKVMVYVNDCKAATSVTNAKVTATPSTLKVNEKVTLKAEAKVTNGSGNTTYTFDIENPNGQTTTTNKGTTSSLDYTPTIAGTYTCTVTVKNNSKEATATCTFTVNPAVTFTKVEATKGTEGLTGSASTINYDYAVTGSTAEPSSIKLLLNGTEFGGNYTVDKANKTITFTPTTANRNYLFSVAITIDGVTGTTNEVSYNIRDPYKATLSVEGDNAIYKGQGEFTLKVSDNSDQYGTPTYALYKDGALLEGGNTTGEFTVSADTVGTSEYYVEAAVSGEVPAKGTTNTVKLTVKDTVFSVYLTAPKSTMEDHEFTVTANVEFPPKDCATLVYELKGSDGKTYTSNNGQFTVVADCPEDKESVDVTYTVTVYAKSTDGSLISTVTDTAKVTITKDHGVYPIRILFKCSDTYGYLPNMSVKINGNDAVDIARQKYAAIESRPNATDTATYSWYYYEIPDVDYGTDIVFSANATRNYFYNASITIKAGQGDFVQDGTFYCYYLALENLNGGTNVLSNISALDEAHRNWTASAVNMIYDDADALLPVGVNFAYANMNDANTDGKVNVKDATYIQKSLANIVEASALSTAVSDVNNDGKVTIKDATALQKQIAGL